MSKRRLSKLQANRIAQNQRSELQSEQGSSAAAHATCNGRVISHFGQQLDVENLHLDHLGEIVRCHQRSNLPALVTGDYVVWQQDSDETGIILALGDRSSLFGRLNSSGEMKPVAANVDIVLVVIAPVPQPFLNLIDRYLVAIETLQLEPILVLNKSDLVDEENKEELDRMLSIYSDLGYEVHRVSASDGAGIEELQASLTGNTTVLVGQSGVGKSSLINEFGLEDMAIVGGLSASKEKGTHTTTTAKLFHLPLYDLVDSPGIREFSLGQISPDQLFDGFKELSELRGQCKFRDCAHRSEPNCAVLRALESGVIHPDRLASYFQILESIVSKQ